jgi:hypothetical protein
MQGKSRVQSESFDPRDEMETVFDELDALNRVFQAQLVACLEECVRGRRGLFAEAVGEEDGWPEAARLRELAIALEGLFLQQEKRNPLCDEFLDLCSIHGEANPGERRLARAFLERIESGRVGAPADENKPW